MNTYGIGKVLGQAKNTVAWIAAFLAALAVIADYLERSATPLKVAQVLSSVASSELLILVYRLLLLLLIVIGLWRLTILERVLQRVTEAQDLKKLLEIINRLDNPAA